MFLIINSMIDESDDYTEIDVTSVRKQEKQLKPPRKRKRVDEMMQQKNIIPRMVRTDIRRY